MALRVATSRYILRRAATRAIAQHPTRQLTARPSSRVTLLAPPTLLRQFHQSRIWLAEEEQRKPAEQAEASPAEAETSGETVTTEPSAAEEQIKEESISSTTSPDAAAPSPKQPTDAYYDAVSESSGTTSAPIGQTEAPAQAAQTSESSGQSIAQQAQDYASSAVQTVQSTASSAARSARDAFESTATANQGRSNADFPPRQPRAPRDRADFASSSDSNNIVRLPRNNDIQPSRILYIGNLFFEVTAPQLEAEFARHGEIANSRVVTDSRGLSKGFAYVEFATQEAADKAVAALDQKVFQGRRMAVQYHVRREPRTGGGERGVGGSAYGGGSAARDRNAPSKTLFIGNMSYQMSDRDLNDLFREIRNVLDVRVAIDRRSGQPRGFAHADFIDVASAEKAKEHLEKKEVYGRQLRVDFSASSSATRSEGLGEGDA
ncbi:hypothetical protein LTR36_002563 [Oleoguttula mirabilis]|uniref:RRM domain-containing protein n=1 Tax=Oleoguttula mirabilis TaxID=1507867 RepID=A0AAV9JK59_9PEZI|nr:hypothetical protein LTR36_002563 [Oleoguttula mirabilis]